MGTNLWALPAGMQRDGLVAGGLSRTARFGSVVATSYDIRVRAIERLRLHADLTILAKLACALARARAVPLAA